MRATENSIDRPMRGGITTPKTIMAAPTRKIVSVWPSPHIIPISAALRTLICLLTNVDTATTWSGSVECLIPRISPSPVTKRKVPAFLS